MNTRILCFAAVLYAEQAAACSASLCRFRLCEAFGRDDLTGIRLTMRMPVEVVL